MTTELAVRPAAPADLPAVQRIYAHHVMHGLGSFEEVPPDLAEMTRRYEAVTQGGFPYLVAAREGAVIGFAYAGPYRPRPAYRYTLEDSVYVAPAAVGQGVGAALLQALIPRAEALGARLMVAVIGDSGNHASYCAAHTLRLPPGRHHPGCRLQARPLGRRGDPAAAAWAGSKLAAERLSRLTLC
jgi:phosphinothricin acetyltransferase